MTRVDSITIKSFKSIVDGTIELGRVNVFIGANGSGKSNLLEAIGVLGAASAGRVDDEALLRRGVRPGVAALYKSSFTGHRPRPSIRLEAKSSSAGYAVELNNPLNDPRPAWHFKNESLMDGRKKIVGRSPATSKALDPRHGLAALKAVELHDTEAGRLLDSLSRFSIYSPNTNTLRSLQPDPQQREPVGLSGGRLAEAVKELLEQLRRHPSTVKTALFQMIPWAKSIGHRPSDGDLLSPSVANLGRMVSFVDRFMAEGRNRLTGYDASEGALYILFMAVLALSTSAPPFLAVDNADHGLNPRLARALFQNLCDWVPAERQILLTTHNPLALDGLPLHCDEIRLFTVDRSRKGLTQVKRVTVTPRQINGEYWTLSRLWVNGHLGGVPDV